MCAVDLTARLRRARASTRVRKQERLHGGAFVFSLAWTHDVAAGGGRQISTAPAASLRGLRELRGGLFLAA